MTFAEIIYRPLKEKLTRVLDELDRLNDENSNAKREEVAFDLGGHLDAINQSLSGDNTRCLQGLSTFLQKADVSTVILAIGGAEFPQILTVTQLGAILEADQLLDFGTAPNLAPPSFTIVEDEGVQPPFAAFGYENPVSPLDSVGFINFSRSDWPDEIGSSGLTHSLLAAFAYAISSATFVRKAYVVVRVDATGISARSTLRLQAVAHGRTVHTPAASRLAPSLSAVKSISAAQPTQQFDELILIFSEYNSHRDILSKFLSLYHVVESFMFKVPIVDLSVNSGGRMFSIRDFKRIYKHVDMNEGDALKSFVTLFWETTVSGRRFSNLVIDNVRTCQRSATVRNRDADEFLSKIGLYSVNGLAQLGGVNAKVFSNFLYSVRNAIVHNGETEHHISHHNLNDSVITLIETVLMGPLEALMFSLIGDHNSKVWYRGPSLLLYAN